MKGLLRKDFALLKLQKKTYLVILLMYLMIGVTKVLKEEFIMGYLPFLFFMFVMSSISYDEFDNGMAFLMVLPVTRTQYVMEKYLLGICISGASELLAFALSAALRLQQAGMSGLLEWLPEGVTAMGTIGVTVAIFLAVMLPVQLKFGSEKGRMVLFGLAIAVFGLLFLLAEYGKPVLKKLDVLVETLAGAEVRVLCLLFFGVALAALLFSCRISVHIMNKKEF